MIKLTKIIIITSSLFLVVLPFFNIVSAVPGDSLTYEEAIVSTFQAVSVIDSSAYAAWGDFLANNSQAFRAFRLFDDDESQFYIGYDSTREHGLIYWSGLGNSKRLYLTRCSQDFVVSMNTATTTNWQFRVWGSVSTQASDCRNYVAREVDNSEVNSLSDIIDHWYDLGNYTPQPTSYYNSDWDSLASSLGFSSTDMNWLTRRPAIVDSWENIELHTRNQFNASIAPCSSGECSYFTIGVGGVMFAGGSVLPEVPTLPDVIDKDAVLTTIEDSLEGTVFEPLTPVIQSIVGGPIDLVNFFYEFISFLFHIPTSEELQGYLDRIGEAWTDKYNIDTSQLEALAGVTPIAAPSDISIDWGGVPQTIVDFDQLESAMIVFRPLIASMGWLVVIFYAINTVNRVLADYPAV